jgi:hypothetical protein
MVPIYDQKIPCPKQKKEIKKKKNTLYPLEVAPQVVRQSNPDKECPDG